MSTKLVVGPSSGDIIGRVTETPTHLFVVLVPWFFTMLVIHIGEYWTGHCNSQTTPEGIIRFNTHT